MRYTSRDVRSAFVRYAKALGLPILANADSDQGKIAARLKVHLASYVKDEAGHFGASEDCLFLDENPTYGGSSVAFIKKGHTGHWENPWGSYWMLPGEFVRAVGLACRAVEFAEQRAAKAHA